ncbi:glycine/betaine ABC transporter [Salicibibacter cibarius]|uniref:Glycine/betaine ABC transporter n=1 Tax=Salicibibacter cibarius TaxID=2743000 RepID=A0A7T7CAK3_9BACI|nr:glycine betaine ABC transporter substrate-binding protein [Salicibibacter cibarius]QQK74987.1 glycine/betaine ABC transporter [Salicibibacter cibarius]
MIKHWKRLGIATGLSLTLVAAGCGADNEDMTQADESGDAEEENYAEEMDYTIVGIDPGAGIMERADQALEDYDLAEWNLQTSSEEAMIAALEDAIDNEEPIVVTGWGPHWKFVDHDLKYLDDPELSFGEAQDIHTLAREEMQEDFPEAYEILETFEWTAEDLEEIMYEMNQGVDEIEAAQNWIDENEDVVASWTEGVDEVDGEIFEIVHGPWGTDLAAAYVMLLVLEDMGYDVELTNVESIHMYTAIGNGDVDAMLTSWLPDSHATFYEQVEGEVEDLGPNIEEGAPLGLVVPEYMDIDSIEDLQEE